MINKKRNNELYKLIIQTKVLVESVIHGNQNQKLINKRKGNNEHYKLIIELKLLIHLKVISNAIH